MMKTTIKRISLLICFLFITLSLTSCSTTCVHCNNEYEDEGCFSSLYLYGNEIIDKNNNKWPTGGNEKVVDIITDYKAFTKYIKKHSKFEILQYICPLAFENNYVFAVWSVDSHIREYKFYNFKIEDNIILFYKKSFTGGDAYQVNSLYFIVIPTKNLPTNFNVTTTYKAYFV